jgi:hypothetical protein
MILDPGSSVTVQELRLRKKSDIYVTLHPSSLQDTPSKLPSAPATAVFSGLACLDFGFLRTRRKYDF